MSGVQDSSELISWAWGNTLVCSPLPSRHSCFQFASLYLFLCTHRLMASLFLLTLSLSLQAFSMCSFSDKHNEHIFIPAAYLLHFSMIVHFTLGSPFTPKSHTTFESAVSCFLLMLVKLFLWFLYLVLNSPSVIPM